MLAERWTPEQVEKAHCIVNDIAEGIDNKESTKTLRMALAIYADLLNDEREKREATNSEIIINLLKKLELNAKQ